MSKFAKKNSTKTTNFAGGLSYKNQDFRKDVSAIILNSMLAGDNFYETEKQRLANIENYVINNPKESEFIAKSMVYVRTVANLRSVSHFLAVLLAESLHGTSYLRKALYQTIVRPDDAMEMVSLWNLRNKGKMIPNSLRRAIKDALETKFNAYHLKKYSGGTNAVKVSDLIKLSHPKGRDEAQSEMFKLAISGDLPNIETVQTVNAGKTDAERKKAYKKMLTDGTMGYMAILKNLKNMLEVGISKKMLKNIKNVLLDQNKLEKSGVLPFRFVQAFYFLKDNGHKYEETEKLIKILNKAFAMSYKNLNLVKDGQKVSMLLDESASMTFNSNELGKQAFTIGKTICSSLLVGLNKEDVALYTWADSSRRRDLNDDKPLDFIYKLRANGGGTNLYSGFDRLLTDEVQSDLLIIFSDMQVSNMGGLVNSSNQKLSRVVAEYREKNPNLKIIFWNLVGYNGSTPISVGHGDVIEIAGFSEKILQVLPKLLDNSNALIEEIDAVSIGGK